MKFSLFKKQEAPRPAQETTQRVCLHIGVHKTASTHLQGTLKLNKPALEKGGIYYLPLKQCRETFTLPCIHKKLGATERGAAFFETAFQEAHTAVVSDENILGALDTLLAGHFYPRMIRNIKRIKAMIGPDRQLDIYCCIRNYGDWLESAYLQTLKRRITPFDTFLKKLALEKISWVHFVEGLADAAGSSGITLWTYEDYSRKSDAILSAIAQDLGVTFDRKNEARPNPSLSEAAVKILVAAEKTVRKEDRAKLYRFVRLNFSTNQNYPKPQLLPSELRSALDAKYRSDLAELRAQSKFRFVDVDSMQVR